MTLRAPKMGKLTAKQVARLRNIDGRVLTDAAPWRGTATDRSLLRRGLIERCDETRKISAQVSFCTFLCKLTPAGRAALNPEVKDEQ